MLALMPTPQVYNPEDNAWDESDPEWEMLFWPRIMFLDAGTISGVAVIWFHPGRLLDPRQPTIRSVLAWWTSFVAGPENEQAREICRLAKGLVGTEGFALGIEKFRSRAVNGTDDFLSSPRIGAKVDYQMWMGVRNSAGELRRIATQWHEVAEIDKSPRGDERLKGLGLYTPGMDHRRDATKHAFAHLGKIKNGGLGAFGNIYGHKEDWKDA